MNTGITKDNFVDKKKLHRNAKKKQVTLDVTWAKKRRIINVQP